MLQYSWSGLSWAADASQFLSIMQARACPPPYLTQVPAHVPSSPWIVSQLLPRCPRQCNKCLTRQSRIISLSFPSFSSPLFSPLLPLCFSFVPSCFPLSRSGPLGGFGGITWLFIGPGDSASVPKASMFGEPAIACPVFFYCHHHDVDGHFLGSDILGKRGEMVHLS